VPSPDSTRPPRGTVGPRGDRFGAVRDDALLFEDLDAVLCGDPDAPVVTLAEGLETVLVAEAALASARGGATETVKVTI
jgi:hypothetical protein